MNCCWSISETERWTTATVIPALVSSDRRPEAKRAKSDSEHDPNASLTFAHHRVHFVDSKLPRQILEVGEIPKYEEGRPIYYKHSQGPVSVRSRLDSGLVCCVRKSLREPLKPLQSAVSTCVSDTTCTGGSDSDGENPGYSGRRRPRSHTRTA